MIVLTIIVAMLIVGIVLLAAQDFFCDNLHIDTECVGAALTVIGAIALVISLIVFAFSYGGIDGEVAANEKRYESLSYQYENDIYENDNDLGKRELMVDIQSWNEDLAKNQAMQDNIWTGIFIPNIYDQFEFIELKPTN